MSEECRIVDEETYNFRRFRPDELEKKYSPFERVQKKDFPFLFQKKHIPKESIKMSLDDIMNKMKDLSFNSPLFHPISENPFPDLLPLSPLSPLSPLFCVNERKTPPPPFELDFDLSANQVLFKDECLDK